MDELARVVLIFESMQNIDSIKHLLPDLEAKTIRLHGQVNQADAENVIGSVILSHICFKATRLSKMLGKACITLVAPAKFYLLSTVPLLSKNKYLNTSSPPNKHRSTQRNTNV